MSRIKVVLLGGEYDLTRMVIEDSWRVFEMAAMPRSMYPLGVVSGDRATEAVFNILRYFRTVKVCGNTWIYEYRPDE